MVVGSNATNFLNYIYHLLMGRLLGPVAYGELAAILSLFGLVSVIPSSLGLVVTKFISGAKTEDEVRNLMAWFTKKSYLLGLVLLVLVIATAPAVTAFMKITEVSHLWLVGATLLFSIPALVSRSILQGLIRFNSLVLSVVAENSFKLVAGVVLVFLGYGVLGSLAGIFISSIVGWFVAKEFIQLKATDVRSPNLIPMIKFAIPVVIQSISVTSLYSSDLILVKHFFSSYDAGIYSALSNLGKIIFFGAGPIGAVMFPLVSKRQSLGEKYRAVFNLSLAMTIVLAGIVLVFYYLFPGVAIRLLYGSLYLEAADLLVWFGVFITLFTISSLHISFYMSISQTKVVLFPAVAALVQLIGIWFWHDSLLTVIQISTIISAGLLTSLILLPKLFSDKSW